MTQQFCCFKFSWAFWEPVEDKYSLVRKHRNYFAQKLSSSLMFSWLWFYLRHSVSPASWQECLIETVIKMDRENNTKTVKYNWMTKKNSVCCIFQTLQRSSWTKRHDKSSCWGNSSTLFALLGTACITIHVTNIHPVLH